LQDDHSLEQIDVLSRQSGRIVQGPRLRTSCTASPMGVVEREHKTYKCYICWYWEEEVVAAAAADFSLDLSDFQVVCSTI